MEATTKDMRLHSRELLAAIDRGEEIVITYHGRKRARLVPFTLREENGREERTRNPLFGLWSDRTGSVDDQVRRMRQPREFD